jgi:hypothetical protein
MTIGAATVGRAMLALAFMFGAVSLTAGTLASIDANNPNAVDAGFFGGGITLYVTVSGIVNLGPPGINTLADGSLVSPDPATCIACWWPGYQYMLTGESAYPITAGGDGINHFVGGGANYDMYNAVPWAPQGPQTTDTTAGGVMRFGAVAGSFSASPTRGDWFYIGTNSSIVTPIAGANLYLAVVDTYYVNNSGSFLADITPVPEPAAIGLALAGLVLLGMVRYRVAR